MLYVIQRKKDNLFYNSLMLKWEKKIDKARIFKQLSHITLFLNFLKCETGQWLASVENGQRVRTEIDDIRIVGLKCEVEKGDEINDKFMTEYVKPKSR